MTVEQKDMILRMRGEGKTYAAIADALGLSTNTVKSYYARDGARSGARNMVLTETTEHAEAGQSQSTPVAQTDRSVCRQCGAELHLHSRNQMKRFCSENCRQKWWRAHPGLVMEKASTSTCAGCGKAFKNGGNPARRYCSRACYMSHRFGGRAVNV